MAKYAPADEAGLKPYVVAVSSWGRTTESVKWARDAANARYQGKGRSLYVTATARRATPEDIERLAPPSPSSDQTKEA